MGNAQCPCYQTNKKICTQCPTKYATQNAIKYCGKCLNEKGSLIKHEHKCHNCDQCINLDSDKHNCICRNCNTSYSKINTSERSIVCDQCHRGHAVYVMRCSYCEKYEISKKLSSHRHCRKCSLFMCKSHGGTNTKGCIMCNLDKWHMEKDEREYRETQGGCYW